MARRAPVLTEAQSRARFKALKAAGCKPERHVMPDGTEVITKEKGCDVRRSNPERPPGEWFDDCVEGVSESSPDVDDPNAVCGDLWYNKMSAAKRREIMHKFENNPTYVPNPLGGGMLLVGLVLGGGLVWYLTTQRQKKAAATTPPPPVLPEPPPPCEVTLEKLNTWGMQAGIGVIYLPFLTTPPNLPDIQASPIGPSVDQYLSTGSIFVIVTSDGRFWAYPPLPGGGVSQTPEEQPGLRGRYCTETAA